MPDLPDLQEIARFIFELGQLRQEARHGWLRINESPESVAEHTQRAACLGYLLAHCEGFEDPNLVATMILFHDMHEARTGDADLVQKRYLQVNEQSAAGEQSDGLGAAGEMILQMWREVDERSTGAGVIAKDAEVLEMAFTARELVVRGNADAQKWIDASIARMKTESGQKLLAIVNDSDPREWWKRIWGLDAT
ncbi:MAG: HD domain-containing protein [Planctomycetes bacterium]|nr:HD domain-containing protein [Planctomycetota bacterium]